MMRNRQRLDDHEGQQTSLTIGAGSWQTLSPSNKHRKHGNRIRCILGCCALALLVLSILGQRSKSQSTQRYSVESRAIRALECRYDGNCPVLSTCAADSSSTLGGVCEPITIKGPSATTSSSSLNRWTTVCVENCRKELELDEHFYQEQWPVVEWTEDVVSDGRPNGCLIGYHRVDEGDRWKDREMAHRDGKGLLDEWMAQRFRYVVRVDPYMPRNYTDIRWISYCFAPCTSDSDCETGKHHAGDTPSYVCVEGACQRNSHYWEKGLEPKKPEMVLVTGATKGYFRGLKNLAASARYWAPHHKLVVYNLGELEQMRDEILSWSNVQSLEWTGGVPRHYPSHVRAGKIYAWKPIIINETLAKYKSIFWLDAGSTLAGPITPAEKIVQRTGMFLVKGQDGDMRLSHPSTYEWFGVNKKAFKTGPHFSGNTQAFLHPSRYIEPIVELNAKCAMDANCISPKGSGLSNHRYDQTTVSIAAYNPKVRAPHYTEYLAASKKQLNPDMKRPSTHFVWTARQGTSFYVIEEENAKKSGKSFFFSEG